MTGEGYLRAEVPLKFAFDSNRSVVKPPLAKVLDYLVPSVKAPGMQARIAAPSDISNPSATLAQERTFSMRDYLVGKGVHPTRITTGGMPRAEVVEVVVGKL